MLICKPDLLSLREAPSVSSSCPSHNAANFSWPVGEGVAWAPLAVHAGLRPSTVFRLLLTPTLASTGVFTLTSTAPEEGCSSPSSANEGKRREQRTEERSLLRALGQASAPPPRCPWAHYCRSFLRLCAGQRVARWVPALGRDILSSTASVATTPEPGAWSDCTPLLSL